jgi:hypothetical protein
MEKRSVGGFVIFIIGIVLALIGIVVPIGFKFSFFIYGIPLIAVGLFIYFNRREDRIEPVNYSKMKGGLKK